MRENKDLPHRVERIVNQILSVLEQSLLVHEQTRNILKDIHDNSYKMLDVQEKILEEISAQSNGKPQVRFWHLAEGQDERIPQTQMKLSKPLKPGFRRPITITPDEPVDVNEAGTFFTIENVTGDSTVTLDPTSTATSLKFWINGDGSTGDKAIRVRADGHVGTGDVAVTLDIEFTVANPDATSLENLVEGPDEPIPA